MGDEWSGNGQALVRMHAHSAVNVSLSHSMQYRRKCFSSSVGLFCSLGRRNRVLASAGSQVSGPLGNEADSTAVNGALNDQANQVETYQPFQGSPPEYPIAPPQVVQVNSGLPPWVWVVVGVLLANVFNKVMDFVRRPQEAMSEMMMKQMANAMNSQMGGSTGASTPGTNPFAYPPGGFPSGFPNQPATPVVDTWASAPAPPPTPPPAAPSPPANTAPTTPSANGLGSTYDPAGVAQSAPPPPPPPPPPTTSSFFQDVQDSNPAAQTAASEATDAQIDQFFENLKDPSMRESLYQNLPESMRTPETLDMLMNNPMVRDQIRKMMKEGGGLQNFANNQPAMPVNPGMDEAVQNQLKSMNVDPQVLSQKLMADPELFKLLNKPNVLSAVMDLQQHPDKLTTYMSDPEVMQVIMKMNELAMSVQAETGAQAQTQVPTGAQAQAQVPSGAPTPPGVAPQVPAGFPPSPATPVESQPDSPPSPSPAPSALESMPSSTPE